MTFGIRFPHTTGAKIPFDVISVTTDPTRMHSSRMRTARSSSRLLGGGGSASVHARIHPPGLGLDTTPLGPGPGHPPGCGPEDLPPGVGLEAPPPDKQPPPGLGLDTPREQNSLHTLLKILPCPNFVAGGNDSKTTTAMPMSRIL